MSKNTVDLDQLGLAPLTRQPEEIKEFDITKPFFADQIRNKIDGLCKEEYLASHEINLLVSLTLLARLQALEEKIDRLVRDSIEREISSKQEEKQNYYTGRGY